MKRTLEPWSKDDDVNHSEDFVTGLKILIFAFVLAAFLTGAYFILPVVFPDTPFQPHKFILTFIGLMLVFPSLFIKRSKQQIRRNVISIIVWVSIMLSLLVAYMIVSG